MTVKEAWESYRSKCVPKDAGNIQLKETKMAFYAGFITMMEINKKITDLPDEQAIQHLQKLDSELNDYIQERLLDAASKRSHS